MSPTIEQINAALSAAPDIVIVPEQKPAPVLPLPRFDRDKLGLRCSRCGSQFRLVMNGITRCGSCANVITGGIPPRPGRRR